MIPTRDSFIAILIDSCIHFNTCYGSRSGPSMAPALAVCLWPDGTMQGRLGGREEPPNRCNSRSKVPLRIDPTPKRHHSTFECSIPLRPPADPPAGRRGQACHTHLHGRVCVWVSQHESCMTPHLACAHGAHTRPLETRELPRDASRAVGL